MPGNTAISGKSKLDDGLYKSLKKTTDQKDFRDYNTKLNEGGAYGVDGEYLFGQVTERLPTGWTVKRFDSGVETRCDEKYWGDAVMMYNIKPPAKSDIYKLGPQNTVYKFIIEIPGEGTFVVTGPTKTNQDDSKVLYITRARAIIGMKFPTTTSAGIVAIRNLYEELGYKGITNLTVKLIAIKGGRAPDNDVFLLILQALILTTGVSNQNLAANNVEFFCGAAVRIGMNKPLPLDTANNTCPVDEKSMRRMTLVSDKESLTFMGNTGEKYGMAMCVAIGMAFPKTDNWYRDYYAPKLTTDISASDIHKKIVLSFTKDEFSVGRVTNTLHRITDIPFDDLDKIIDNINQ